MSNPLRWIATVDEQGRLVVPAEVAAQFGLTPGSEVYLQETGNSLLLRPPVSHLRRIYVEPTNACNLDCRTCMRNAWDEPLGWMSEAVFERVLEGVRAFDPAPTVFFGGFGEPLAHPRLVEMVKQAKDAGARVELISNGILLKEEMGPNLIAAGLDKLWVSIDGATPESYSDVRLGDALPQVIQNLYRLQLYQYQKHRRLVLELGIAFVAMRRNIADLPAVINLGKRLGATHFSVSNVLAHTPELRQERLYERTVHHSGYQPRITLPRVELPRMDFNAHTQAALIETLSNLSHVATLAGYESFHLVDTCPFIEKGSLSVRWDGAVSPCLPLLHSHLSYLDDRQRRIKAHTVGSLLERELSDLWNDVDYLALRKRLQMFDFSPCIYCNSCEFPDQNQSDCFGSPFPACGACLWAQGIIRCP
ncbi:MAG: radical SAM protein [Chloroflexi bacterium]|nr:radical SAM protein [Chloroflexota bacterium]